ncbi:MAG: PIN domain-containing protein [bacterium]|nr:PIN domain-containing protein [bacterium]
MFAIDTNILVYAHNLDSTLNEKAVSFLEKIMNERDDYGDLSVCIPTQVLVEFLNVITRQNVASALTLPGAIEVVNSYLETGVTIINQQDTQLSTFLDLLGSLNTRKTIFDVALAATLKDNDIFGLYTENVSDFKEFDFLTVSNPFE